MKTPNYNTIHFPPDHYFFMKFVAFVGTLERCSRRDAMDALFFECGGIPEENINTYVSHVVIGKGDDNSEKYRAAKSGEQKGYLILLTEQEFFDTIDGKFTPPKNPNKQKTGVIVSEPSDPNWKEKEEQKRLEFIDNKRWDYLEKRKPAGNKYDMKLQETMALQFTKEQVNSMRAALAQWGEAAQVGMAVEECAELIVALQKHTNRTPSPQTLDNIADEIADVEMMLAQMRITFGISDEMIAARTAKKFGKLDKYLRTKK